ncbi:hypothetical protein R50345_08790 [Paenibacillus sp. FSL R5-0345]|uniref:hypothetical protein n=1 Tax=Paenibacillus sp. FSL R5-0345 TaxID=1536770 RepID=UPI0004F7FB1F|nr:hypothetical protein [Paenibacillus sp. FSL R5-0345]AIQ34699.1 hypothetical protein R50345_08790 [Paenibacillus sp. FSL R5-0345]
MLEQLISMLENNGYYRMSYIQRLPKYDKDNNKYEMKYLNILNFDYVFSDKENKEVFIIQEKNKIYTKDEIKRYEEEVASFINFNPHNSLKFNITMVLLAPLYLQMKKSKKVSFEVLELLSSEKDKYFCKKIVLDSKNSNFEEELSILPLVPINISVKDKSNGYNGITLKLKEFINESVFNELIKTQSIPDLQAIEKNLLR